MPVSLPLVAIERASGSVSEICLSLLFIISALIALSRAISSFSFAILSLSRATFASGTASPSAVGGLELGHVARDALVDPLQTPLHLGLGEVLVARIDGLEFANRRWRRLPRSADRARGTAPRTVRQTSRMALPLSLRKSAMVLKSGARRPVSQISSMIALALALEPAARRDAVEIAINVDLEHRRRMIARAARVSSGSKLDRSRACQDQDRRRKRQSRAPDCPRPHSLQVRCREQSALAPINPLYEAGHSVPPPIHAENLSSARVFTQPGPKLTHAAWLRACRRSGKPNSRYGASTAVSNSEAEIRLPSTNVHGSRHAREHAA